jgi:putative hydrolase of the HAD superfamily
VPLTAATAAALLELNAYHKQFNLWETVPDEVAPALAALRARGFQLVVVSNANGTLLDAFTRLGLVESLDVIFDSHVVGIEKPDPRFFQHALEQARARAETTVHVGDLYHVDVVGARSAGIAAVLLDVANLYADYDCRRVRSLTQLVDLLDDDGRK